MISNLLKELESELEKLQNAINNLSVDAGHALEELDKKELENRQLHIENAKLQTEIDRTSELLGTAQRQLATANRRSTCPN